VAILSADVTERKKTENHITELNKELEAFAYSVAHDLRSPLRVINGFCDILLEEHEKNLNAECNKLIGSIARNANKMNLLIDELLHFSRLGKSKIKFEKVDVNKLLKDILEVQLNAQLKKKKTQIKLGNIEPLICDKSLIYHAISNIVGNAIKFSGKRDNPVIEIDSSRDGNNVVYKIKDNGAGFDMNHYDKLFGVFQRLHSDREFKGTGVGLALAHRIISKHNGQIWAESEINKGSTFYFSIPYREELL